MTLMTKLGVEVDISKGGAILQRHLGRLEEWASKNSKNSNNANCKVLHIEWNNKEPSPG